MWINQEQIDFIVRETERSDAHKNLLKTVEALNASRKQNYSAEVVTAHFRNNDDNGGMSRNQSNDEK